MLVRGIEIHGNPTSCFLDVTLKDILSCLHAPAATNWCLLSLEAWSSQEWTIDGLASEAYERAVDTSLNGLPVSRQQMQQLAQVPAQLVNLILLGSAEVATLHSYDTKAAMYASCDYVIEVFDSAYLIVYSTDKAFLACLHSSLEGVRVIA